MPCDMPVVAWVVCDADVGRQTAEVAVSPAARLTTTPRRQDLFNMIGASRFLGSACAFGTKPRAQGRPLAVNARTGHVRRQLVALFATADKAYREHMPSFVHKTPKPAEEHAVAKPAKQLAVTPLPDLALTLVDHTSTFRGPDGGVVTVHGFDLEYRNGIGMHPSDFGPVDDRVYYFRVAGVKYHETAAQSDSFTPMSQVLLVREPSNAHDPNAIQVIGRAGECIGYVPAGAAAKMSSLMKRIGTAVATATVTKSFSAHGRRTSIEILSGVERDIEMTGTVYLEDEAEVPSDDRWKLKD